MKRKTMKRKTMKRKTMKRITIKRNKYKGGVEENIIVDCNNDGSTVSEWKIEGWPRSNEIYFTKVDGEKPIEFNKGNIFLITGINHLMRLYTKFSTVIHTVQLPHLM